MTGYRQHSVNTRQQLSLQSEFSHGFLGLVFDIDGVLFDSRASNMLYYNSIRSAVGLPELSREEEAFCHMASVQESLEAIIPENLRDAAYAASRRINYRESILPLLSLEPGVLDMLHWLRQWNVRCAIFTNRSSSVEELLRFFGVESFFSPLKTAAGGRPKPYPDGLLEILREWRVTPEQIAFIGDSQVDAMAASSADVPFWAFRNNELDARLHVSDFFSLINDLTPLVEGR